ncbi:MAG: GxxExxY protein [Sedimentisphaerales bacterium]|nr:GxxExxY protein [Sedimentisphaerales bacterium]
MSLEKNEFDKISDKEEDVAEKIVDSVYAVHSTLGPGLLENVYEVCFCHELNKRGLSYKRQVFVPIEYNGIKFHEAFRLDVLVEDLVICELKAAGKSNPVWKAQVLTYLKLTGKRLAFLINFSQPLSKRSIRRYIL